MALAGVSPEVLRQLHAAARAPAAASTRQELVAADARHKGRARPPEPFSPAAQRLIGARVAAGAGLQEAVRAAARVLGDAGRALRKSSSEQLAAMREAGEVPAWAEAGILEACGGVADVLAVASAALGGGRLSQALEELQALAEKAGPGAPADLVDADNQEMRCFNDLMDVVERKEKAALELRRLCPDEGADRRAASGAVAAVEQAALAQARVVEELAAAMDRAAGARLHKEQRAAAMRESLRELDAGCAGHARDAGGICACALEEAGRALLARAEGLRGGAPRAAAARGAEPHGGEAGYLEDFIEGAAAERVDPEAGGPELGLHSAIAEAVSAVVASAQSQEAEPAAPETRAPAALPEAPAALPEAVFTARFDEGAPRLGFEVVWGAQQPSVGKVVCGSQAEQNGICSGDVLLAVGGTETRGVPREHLMPLLRARPLELRLRRPRGRSESQGAPAQDSVD